MEESDNIQKCTDENNEDEDENETAPKNRVIDPDMTSDNMKDLKSLNFNSADDVRQALKAAFTSKLPKLVEHTEDSIGQNKDCGNDLLNAISQQDPAEIIETDDSKLNNNNNILQAKKSKELQALNKSVLRKRKGRPPKTGPSKKIKRQSVSTMYIGKLTNIVFLRRRHDSDSDVDSLF